MIRTTVTFVDVSELYHKLGLSDDACRHVDQVGFHNVSYGDADMTLVGNVFALDCILEGLEDYYEATGMVSPWTRDTFSNKYWELVDVADYINLEG